MASAVTGNKMYDGTLPSEDWFFVSSFPNSTFESNKISRNEDGTFHLDGILQIRDTKQPISFDFFISDTAAQPVTMTASFPLNRLGYGIGLKSDAEAEWVSRDIQVDLKIVATRE
jgi:cytochrome b561